MQIDRVPRITQEPGALARIGKAATRLAGPGATVLLVADPGLKPLGITGRAEEELRKSGLAPVTFDGFEPEPAALAADYAATMALWHKAKAVVAVGGGSAMDVGKAAACIAAGDFCAAEYALKARPFPPKPLARICVPTTSGTGSETTRFSVLTGDDGVKSWLWGDELKPDEAILDPELTLGLPPDLTAATAMDALVHAIEAATSNRASPLVDLFAHEAIRLVVRHLGRALERPEDLEARAGLQRAATLAGIAIDNAGTTIGHAMGHALGTLCLVHHGRAVALATLATLDWFASDDPDGRFAAVAAAMGEADGAAALPAAFERLVRSSGVEVALEAPGVSVDDFVARMLAPENLPMVRCCRRVPEEADLRRFAERLLTQS